jgi:DNA polymerase-3 subunit gamma/tau
MRDALSILDQCISFHYGEEVTLEKVLDILGAVDTGVFFHLTDILIKQDSAAAMALINEISMQGRDIRQFVLDYIRHLRNLLVVTSAENIDNVLDLSEEYIKQLKDQVKNIQGSTIMRYIHVFSELENQLKYTTNQRILLEVGMIRLCQPMLSDSSDALLERIHQLEEKMKNGVMVSAKTSEIQGESVKKEEPKKILRPKAVSEDIKKGISLWNDIKAKFDGHIPGLLKETEAGYLEDDIYYIVFPNEMMTRVIKKEMIGEKLEEIFQKQFRIELISVQEYNRKYQQIYGDTEQPTKETDEIERIIQHFEQIGVNVEVE